MHFVLVLLSNQSQLLVMFKFFVQNVFAFAIYFHQFHLKRIPKWYELKLGRSGAHLCRHLLSQRKRLSLLAIYFQPIVLLIVGGTGINPDTELSEKRGVCEYRWSEEL
jgi:hypothetical protein